MNTLLNRYNLILFFYFLLSGKIMSEEIAERKYIEASINYELNSTFLIQIKNVSSKDLYLTPWDVLDNGLISKDIFKVYVDGKEVSYTGVLLKRPEPTMEDLIKLSKGEVISSYVDVFRNYNSGNKGHSVQVKFDSIMPIYNIECGKPKVFTFETVKSNEVTVKR